MALYRNLKTKIVEKIVEKVVYRYYDITSGTLTFRIEDPGNFNGVNGSGVSTGAVSPNGQSVWTITVPQTTYTRVREVGDRCNISITGFIVTLYSAATRSAMVFDENGLNFRELTDEELAQVEEQENAKVAEQMARIKAEDVTEE